MVARKANRSERGSYTIEAILALTSFMFAFIAIVSCATIAKVESTTQYAIDQIAKEISQYYYIAERLKIANTDKDGSQEVDDMIQSIVDFGNMSSSMASKYSGTTSKDFSEVIKDFGTIQEDVNDVKNAAEKVYSSIGTVMTDKKKIVSTLATAVLKQIGNEALSRVVAQPICKALMPQYITSDGDANATLLKMGVIDGLDGLNFEMSSFLRDQRSINIVLFYRIKVNGFGLYDRILNIKQTASTAAWVTGTKLKEVTTSESILENETKSGKDEYTWIKGLIEDYKDETSYITGDKEFVESLENVETDTLSAESEENTLGIKENGQYTSKDEVALYLHLYGHLPSNYITKREAQALGWKANKGNLQEVAPGKIIGGDTFHNYEGNLKLTPKEGRLLYECDVNYTSGYRTDERLVFSDDGLVFYTNDHFGTFVRMY